MGAAVGGHLATASVETFRRQVRTEPEGKCLIEWTDENGVDKHCEVFEWQRIDGFEPGDVIDVTTQGRADRTLRLPATARRERVEITLDPDDVVVVQVGETGWQYGAVIRGARPYLG